MLTAGHLLALLLTALRGGGHGGANVVMMVMVMRVVVTEKHAVHVRGRGSAAWAGV